MSEFVIKELHMAFWWKNYKDVKLEDFELKMKNYGVVLGPG